MNVFFSEDKMTTKMIIVLDVDPYSLEGMAVARQISQSFGSALDTTSLKGAKWGVSGITQMNVDLQAMAGKDFAMARVIMLAGIFVVMLFITRDFWMTLFVSMSLVASYFIALSLAGLGFKYVLSVPQLSWNVPFFSFIMVVTLGVDYSIFLIMRQKENHNLSLTESVVDAAAKVGSVIVSAGLILSGTFAAMLPSGVLTLMEVSVTVIIGILLLCLVFIPIFIPSMISFQARLSEFQESESRPRVIFRPRHSNG
jgi:putative drug exporter of the RND superfamily